MKNGSRQKLRKIKGFLQFNVYGYTTHPNSWDILKSIVRSKVTVLNAYIKKTERGRLVVEEVDPLVSACIALVARTQVMFPALTPLSTLAEHIHIPTQTNTHTSLKQKMSTFLTKYSLLAGWVMWAF